MKTLLLLLSVLLSGGSVATAQVPQLLNYQGRIAVNGTNFTGTGQFKFALVSASTNASVPATAGATVSFGFLVNITVINGGSGYSTPPGVVITDSTGSGAVAYAQISVGTVTNIVVTSAGSNYSASPSITVAAPPQQNISTTFWSNDGSSNAGGQPATSVPLPVKKGLYSVLLGDTTLSNMTALSASVFANPGVWLRVWFNDGLTGFQQLTPDQRLAAVGYAIMAGTVPDGSITASKIAPGAVGTEQLTPGAGGTLNFQTAGITNLQAVANFGYIFTNAGAKVVTLPPAPAVGDRVRVTGNASGFTLIANVGQSIISPPDFDFIPRSPAGYWECFASSSDGSKLIAGGDNNGYLYTSTNYGVNWTQQTNAGSGNWRCVASSSDGSKLIAGNYNSYLCTSTNYGVNWAQQTNAGSGNWQCVASSSDGSKLIAGKNNGYLYTSTNYGVNWTQQTNAGSGNWQCVASSSDGSKLIAGNNGYLCTSTNFGVDWTQQTNAGSGSWRCAASSSDGSKLIAGNNNGYLCTSTNFGVNWTQQTNAGSGYWYCAASSSDGSKLIAGNYSDNYIYVSTNYGVNWNHLIVEVDYWQGVACSSDGSRIVAAGKIKQDYYLFILPDFITQWSTVYVHGSAYSTIELFYAGGGLWVPGSFTGSFTIE